MIPRAWKSRQAAMGEMMPLYLTPSGSFAANPAKFSLRIILSATTNVDAISY